MPGNYGARCHGNGQGLVEYGLILAVAVIVAAVALLLFGDQISAFVSALANAA